MIIYPITSATANPSVHRALWALLPARVQRLLGVLRPLGEIEAPAAVSREALGAAALFILLLAAMQQWVWLGLLLAALVMMPACWRVLHARRQRERARRADLAAGDDRAQRESDAQRAGLDARTLRTVREASALVATMPLFINFLASACRSKTKSINHNLTLRTFGQQLAGAAYI